MGVVGTAVARGEAQRISDVTKFAGHIACDPLSKSEIVIPIFKQDNVSLHLFHGLLFIQHLLSPHGNRLSKRVNVRVMTLRCIDISSANHRASRSLPSSTSTVLSTTLLSRLMKIS